MVSWVQLTAPCSKESGAIKRNAHRGTLGRKILDHDGTGLGTIWVRRSAGTPPFSVSGSTTPAKLHPDVWNLSQTMPEAGRGARARLHYTLQVPLHPCSGRLLETSSMKSFGLTAGDIHPRGLYETTNNSPATRHLFPGLTCGTVCQTAGRPLPGRCSLTINANVTPESFQAKPLQALSSLASLTGGDV